MHIQQYDFGSRLSHHHDRLVDVRGLTHDHHRLIQLSFDTGAEHAVVIDQYQPDDGVIWAQGLVHRRGP